MSFSLSEYTKVDVGRDFALDPTGHVGGKDEIKVAEGRKRGC